MRIITREEATARGLTRYFTGKPCANGHVAERRAQDGKCTECRREHRVRQRGAKGVVPRSKQTPEQKRQAWREYYAENRAKEAARQREYYARNRAKEAERKRRSKQTPLGRLRKLCGRTAERLSLGHLNHSRLELLGYTATEFIAHLESTLPDGMSFEDAKAEGWHIDHIIPLYRVTEVIPDPEQAFIFAMQLNNLRMIPAEENISKGARINTAGAAYLEAVAAVL